MNLLPADLETMLASRAKDPLCAIEFYAGTYEPHITRGFEPDDALARFATETVASYQFTSSVAVSYVREALSLPSLSRSMGKQSNSVTVRFSNVSKVLATFVLSNEVEGMKLVVRLLSRSNLTNVLGSPSWVLFAGKCGPPQGFDRKDASITARQDLGQIEAQIPPRVFQKDCPLRFKGEECLGTEALGAKSATYQAALTCNKTFGQCTQYENTEFYQGIRVVQIEGSFRHRPHQGFFTKLAKFTVPLIYAAFLRRKNITVGSSTEDGTPYGKAIPAILGRWQMMGIPLQYRDIGTSINCLFAWCRGPITAIQNLVTRTPGFEDPNLVTHHYGRYGGQADQGADTVFPEGGFFSRLAYTTCQVLGTDIAIEDPAPEVAAMIAGIQTRTLTLDSNSISGEGVIVPPNVYDFVVDRWTDNPVDLSLFVLTDAGLLNIPQGGIDYDRSGHTSVYTLGAVKDDTNAERLVLPDTETSKAGVDYHRYNSTGLITEDSWPITSGQLPVSATAHEAKYEFYDPDAPPTSVALRAHYRKRYTANIALTEQKKAIDFLYDTLLPSFRGYLSWDYKGRVGVKCERPADSNFVYSASIVGATTIKVGDVMPWRFAYDTPFVAVGPSTGLIGKILIGVGLATSEVRSVTETAYSADGNSITLATSASGSAVLTASGANLSGGSASAPATGTVTVTGSFAEDDTVTITIDGEDSTYTLFAGETQESVAASLAFAINANREINKYVVAHCLFTGNVITIAAKIGVLTLSSALEEAHDVDEETIRVMMSFATYALPHADTTKANVLDGSFKYLGTDGQTRHNQFKGTFHDPLRDFAEQPVIINDYDHQEQIEKINPLDIDLSAVDNYNQAARLLNGAASKFGDGVDFFSWASNGLALQLEEGDRVCLTDPNSGDFRNVPVTIESLSINSNYEISFKSRIYSTSMYDDFVEQTDVPLPSGLTNFAEGPPSIAFNTTDFPPDGLAQSTDGTAGITSIRGGAVFTASLYAQYATVRLIKRAGVTVNEQVAVITPDSNLEAVFEFIASADGLYTVELEVCNQWGCNATKPTADIIIGFGSLYGLAMEDGFLLLTESSDIIEVEH